MSSQPMNSTVGILSGCIDRAGAKCCHLKRKAVFTYKVIWQAGKAEWGTPIPESPLAGVFCLILGNHINGE